MPRFFVETVIDEDCGWIELAQTDAHHLLTVKRASVGDVIEVCDQHHHLYQCEVTEETLTRDPLRVRILSVDLAQHELPFKVILYQGLPKGDKMNLLVRECVELGVHAIVPTLCTHSVSRPDFKKLLQKIERWQKVSQAAAKQSGRDICPEICMGMSIPDAIDHIQHLQAKDQARHILLVPYEAEKEHSLKAFVQRLSSAHESLVFHVFIGPEGGFSLNEIEQLKSAGASLVTLGPRILRTETAGMVVLSMLAYALEQLP